MKISGFTIVRNVIKYNYPILEAIQSILPICDEFIVNDGYSDDGTLELIRSLRSPKIRIIQTRWDRATQKPDMLSFNTNVALKECKGDWAFYVQADEVIHEDDLPRLVSLMRRHLHDKNVEAFRFKWMHFYGSYYRYRIDRGWFQKQDRIIRNNGTVGSFGDAFGFRRKDGRPLGSRPTGCLLYHYGWVNTLEDMQQRCQNAAAIGYQDEGKSGTLGRGGYGDLNRFPVYFGTHPAVMDDIIARHAVSGQDRVNIRRAHWFNPLLWLRYRYKTGRRVKTKIV